MRARSVARTTNIVARAWLVVTMASLLLPGEQRAGWWLPLHLFVIGSLSTAIGGNVQAYATSFTAGREPSSLVVGAQLVSTGVAAALIPWGVVHARPGLVRWGGIAFGVTLTIVAVSLARAWLTRRNARHGTAIALYGGAVLAAGAGALVGALLGSRVIAQGYPEAREAHMMLMVLGWASLPIAATVPVLLPAALRVRAPGEHRWVVVVALVAGAGALGVATAYGWRWVATVAAVVFAAGAVTASWLGLRAFTSPARRRPPAAAFHLGAGLVWFVLGSLTLAWSVGRGGFVMFREGFLAMFVAGWLLQTLLGAWLTIVVAGKPGSPEERRRYFAAVEIGGATTVVAFNLAVAILALASADLLGEIGGTVGGGLLLVSVTVALVRSAAFGAIARTGAAARKAERWFAGAEERP